MIYKNLRNLYDLGFGQYYIGKNYVNEEKDSLLTSFFKGYLTSDEKLEKYIQQYLWRYYDINPHKNSCFEQIDHYAFEKGLDWDKGFMKLMQDIVDKSPEKEDFWGMGKNKKVLQFKKKPAYVYDETEYLIPEVIENTYSSIKLKNGFIVNIGDIIELSDKIGEDYKKTKFYDIDIRNPSWELFYPSEKDFKHIFFYYGGDKIIPPFNFGRVWRLFSNSKSLIKYISIQNETIFLYTDFFKIDIEKAIEEREIKFLQNSDASLVLSNFSLFIYGIKECGENFRTPKKMSDMLKLLDYWCFFLFSVFKKNWQNAGVSMGGWHKTPVLLSLAKSL